MKRKRTYFSKFPISFIVIIFPFLLTADISIAQSFESIMQEGLKMEQASNEKAALIKFREAQKLKPTDLTVLCKCSDLSGSIGNKEKSLKLRNKYFETSLSFAKIACNTYPKSDEANVSMSIALGRIALTKNGKDKIELVKDIKSYADNAIKLNPNNAIAWHVLGKWYYEISNLNFIEKNAVNLFFGKLPEASFQKSINAFEKAKILSKDFMQNYLELARAYKKTGQNRLALSNLNDLIKLPAKTQNDILLINEAKLLLNSIQ